MLSIYERKLNNLDLADQSEHVVGFVSDWLELDSLIEGVRYDSEIVR